MDESSNPEVVVVVCEVDIRFFQQKNAGKT
jgi:hypothetical protein